MWEMGELDYFPLNYDEHYLHVGQELFLPLDHEAQVSLEAIVRVRSVSQINKPVICFVSP